MRIKKLPLEIVQDLLRVISRQAPLQMADTLLSKRLAVHMDGKSIGPGGPHAWHQWVSYLHATADKKMSSLRIVVDEIVVEGDMVDVAAHWCGVIDGVESRSDIGRVRYQVRDGQVASIWTHRANYVFIYGQRMADSTLAFYYLLWRVSRWRFPKG